MQYRLLLLFQAVCLPRVVLGGLLRSGDKGLRKSVFEVSRQKVSNDDLFYGVVVDAGSSGSRIRMFKWTLRKNGFLTEIMPLDDDEHLFQVTPGLSAHGDEPTGALPALYGLIAAAKKYIPKSVWDETLFYLKATAGMRLLPTRKATAVMNIVREFLSDQSNCPFKFVSAQIISGEEEAVFTYLSTNYNLGLLTSPDQTLGAVEMGGASMQVIFRPEDDIQDNEFQFYLADQRHSVYAKSYIKFGVNSALGRMLQVLADNSPDVFEIASPCHNRGFKGEELLPSGHRQVFVGSGNMTACIEVVRKVMGLDIECLMPPCAIFGSYMTPVSGNFYAIASFFYTANGLGLVGWKDSKALSPNHIAAGTASYCDKDLATAQSENGAPMKFAEKYCFMGVYVHQSLLAFGFDPDDMSVTYSRKINGFNMGWPAGSILYETQLMPLSIHPKDSGIKGLCGQTPPNDLQIDVKPHRERSGGHNLVTHFIVTALIVSVGSVL